MPFFWKRGIYTKKLENFFKDYLEVNYAISFIQGRVGLYAILRALNLKKGDQVLVQSYTHVAVSNAIIWNKAIPVYVDIYSDTFNMDNKDLEKKITKKSKVLIIQHTYGLVAEVDKLLKIAKKHNLFVIEDCAHAIGSEYKGQKAGTFADAAFFSLGRNKLIDATTGGMVVTRHNWLAQRLNSYRDKLAFPGYQWILKFLFFPVGIKLTNQIYYFFNIGEKLYEHLRKIGFFPKAVVEEEKIGKKPNDFEQKLPDAMAFLAYQQLKELDKLIAHRRRLAKLYDSKLKNLHLMLPKEPKGYFHTYLVYNVLTDKNLLLIQKAIDRNILIGNWFHKSAIEMAEADFSKFYYHPRLCPMAENLAQKSLDLPTVPAVSLQDARSIANFVKDYFRKFSGKSFHNLQISNL